jgi:hypothetical protein
MATGPYESVSNKCCHRIILHIVKE